MGGQATRLRDVSLGALSRLSEDRLMGYVVESANISRMLEKQVVDLEGTNLYMITEIRLKK